MSDTAKKQVRKLKIIEDDPNLSAFESDLNERVRHFKQRKKELLAPGQLGDYDPRRPHPQAPQQGEGCRHQRARHGRPHPALRHLRRAG